MRKTLYYFIPLVATICLLIGCRGGGNKPGNDTKSPIDTPKVSLPENTVKPVINVYIENSGSMDGYLKGNTEFKAAIGNLLAKLPYYYDEKDISLRFINSKIDSISTTKADLSSFVKEIDMYWAEGLKIRSSTTNLNNIFKDILSQTDSKTISILFSDCIYSISKGGVEELLNYEKSLTMNRFLMKSKQEKVDLATIILKMKSKFDGKYFPYTGDNDWFKINMERPYYICVIGNQDILNDFNQKIDMKVEKIGYDNRYVLSSEDPKGIYYSVLQSTYNKGRFKPLRKESGKDYIHGIENVKLARSGENLTFAIAVDFSSLQVENDYICNLANYTVTTDNFEVAGVSPIILKEIMTNDLKTIESGKPTHVIVLKAKTKAISDVSFALKKQIPQWVYDSDTYDDTHPEKGDDEKENKKTWNTEPANLKDKTFGLRYWVEGISEAYETIYPDNKNYFECSITIK